VSADAGITSPLFPVAFGPARLHSALGAMLNRPTIIVVAILIAGVALFLLSRGSSYLVFDRKGLGARVMTPRAISVGQLSSVFDQLNANHKDASWVAFTFCPPDGPASDETSVTAWSVG
jgi:hypothetical protein